jgi:hypothetical protein
MRTKGAVPPYLQKELAIGIGPKDRCDEFTLSLAECAPNLMQRLSRDTPIPLFGHPLLQDGSFRIQSECVEILPAVSNNQANHLTLFVLLGNNMPEEFAFEKLCRT